MRGMKKVTFIFLLLCMFLLGTGISVCAAQKEPGNVKRLKAKAVSETSVKLWWSKASDADGYYVYRVGSGGSLKRIATTSKRSYTVKKLKVNKNYTYKVYAYRKSGKKVYKSEAGSPQVTIATQVKTPATPSDFRTASYGNKTILLKWSKVKDATGYIVYRYDEKTGTYKRLGKTKETSFRATGLKAETTYKFVVRSYRTLQGKAAYSKKSKEVKGKARTYSSSAASVHGRYFNATVKSKATATVSSTGKKVTLRAGTKVTSTSRGSGNVTVILKNGSKAKMSGSKLRYTSIKTTKKYYTKKQKEAFINEKGYSSKTKYLIWISQYTMNVNIFRGSEGEWKLVRSGPCVIGQMGRTPVGTFRLIKRGWEYGGPKFYFTWNSRTGKGNSFHRRIDGNTRSAVSLGCVRLSDSDLNFINRNCPLGTTVVSY